MFSFPLNEKKCGDWKGICAFRLAACRIWRLYAKVQATNQATNKWCAGETGFRRWVPDWIKRALFYEHGVGSVEARASDHLSFLINSRRIP